MKVRHLPAEYWHFLKSFKHSCRILIYIKNKDWSSDNFKFNISAEITKWTTRLYKRTNRIKRQGWGQKEKNRRHNGWRLSNFPLENSVFVVTGAVNLVEQPGVTRPQKVWNINRIVSRYLIGLHIFHAVTSVKPVKSCRNQTEYLSTESEWGETETGANGIVSHLYCIDCYFVAM